MARRWNLPKTIIAALPVEDHDGAGSGTSRNPSIIAALQQQSKMWLFKTYPTQEHEATPERARLPHQEHEATPERARLPTAEEHEETPDQAFFTKAKPPWAREGPDAIPEHGACRATMSTKQRPNERASPKQPRGTRRTKRNSHHRRGT